MKLKSPNSTPSVDIIGPFRGEYHFLSNFYTSHFDHDGRTWSTAEHAYQAAKTLVHASKDRIQNASTPGKAKKMGRRVDLRPGWEDMKMQVMSEICLAKFGQNPELAKKLLKTGNAELVEKNNWGDTYWGRCNGQNRNALGEILMDVRQMLRTRRRIQRW